MDTNNKFEFMRDILGDETLLIATYKALNVEKQEEILDYIATCHDLNDDIDNQDMIDYISADVDPCICSNHKVTSDEIGQYINEWQHDFIGCYYRYDWWYYSYYDIAIECHADSNYKSAFENVCAQQFGYDTLEELEADHNCMFWDNQIDGFIIAMHK